jgi:hypothetical protein
MKTVSELQALLSQTVDPAEYDELVKQIAEAEKAQSITTATNKAAEAARAEAHRKAQEKELADLLSKGDELKGIMLAGKGEMVGALNKFFLSLDNEWKTFHQLKAIQNRITEVSSELGDPVKFGFSGAFWHTALSDDPRQIAKMVMSVFATEWSLANYHRGQPTSDTPKLIDVKTMDASKGA